MSDILYLAWKYLTYHRFKTAVLVASIALIVYLPIGLQILVTRSSHELTSRANATPLLVGAKGSPLELVLSSLYFESDTPAQTVFGQNQRVMDSELALAIPMHIGFRTSHGPIVGTSLEYFEFRGLTIQDGRLFGMLGECVLGASAAKQSGLSPGDSIMSLPESVFDIAGVYPLKMKVAGVLAPSGTPDDSAVLVDIKTTWVIAGLAHGHQDLDSPEAESAVLRKEGNTVVANASVMQYNEITPNNVESFHFHGRPDTFPITSVIAIPHDDKSGTLLMGRYLGTDEPVQIIEPPDVMAQLLATVFTVRRYVLVAVGVLVLATTATMALVFMLSLQLRRREMETIIKIGGSKARVLALVAAEIVSVVAAGTVIAAGLSSITALFASAATRLLVQMS